MCDCTYGGKHDFRGEISCRKCGAAPTYGRQRIAELEDAMRMAAHRLEIGGDPKIVASGLRLVAGQKPND